MIDFLNDEDLHIQIDALECVTEILDQLNQEQIDEVYIPCLINFIDLDNLLGQVDINQRIAELFGSVVANLKAVNLHLKYKNEIINYYKGLCENKEEPLRFQAVYILPCMNLVYKSVEKEMDIDFQELYLRFSEDPDYEVRKCIATSLHEAFRLVSDDEDTTQLRKVFYSYILDNNREIILIINRNLDIMIEKYGNKHTLANFKGRTPYVECLSSNDGGSRDNTPKSKPVQKSDTMLDFSTGVALVGKKKMLTKK